MIISADDIEIPDEVLLFYSIPSEVRDWYKVRSMNNGEYFIVSFKSLKVAFVAPLRGKSFEFTYFDNVPASLKFKEIMEKASKTKGKSLPRWLVLVSGSDNCWQYIGIPEMTRDNALAWIGSDQDKKLMVVVSYADDEVKGTLVKTRTANYVTFVSSQLKVAEENMGAIGFQVTNWSKK